MTDASLLVLLTADLKAWRKAPVDDAGQIPKAWLIKVARNTAISLL